MLCCSQDTTTSVLVIFSAKFDVDGTRDVLRLSSNEPTLYERTKRTRCSHAQCLLSHCAIQYFVRPPLKLKIFNFYSAESGTRHIRRVRSLNTLTSIELKPCEQHYDSNILLQDKDLDTHLGWAHLFNLCMISGSVILHHPWRNCRGISCGTTSWISKSSAAFCGSCWINRLMSISGGKPSKDCPWWNLFKFMANGLAAANKFVERLLLSLPTCE